MFFLANEFCLRSQITYSWRRCISRDRCRVESGEIDPAEFDRLVHQHRYQSPSVATPNGQAAFLSVDLSVGTVNSLVVCRMVLIATLIVLTCGFGGGGQTLNQCRGDPPYRLARTGRLPKLGLVRSISGMALNARGALPAGKRRIPLSEPDPSVEASLLCLNQRGLPAGHGEIHFRKYFGIQQSTVERSMVLSISYR